MAHLTPIQKLQEQLSEIEINLEKITIKLEYVNLLSEKENVLKQIFELQTPKIITSKIPISICYKVKGKVKDRNAAEWNYLRNNYEQHEMTPKEIAQTVQQGYAICCSLFNKVRLIENFKYSELIAIDIDDSLTLDKALASKFVQNYCSLIYTTSSHTPEKHKFRLIFKLEKGISDPVEYKKTYQYLADMFKGADPHCKDVCRIFFGSINCEYWIFDKILTVDMISKLESRYNEKHKPREIKNIAFQQDTDRDYNIAIDILNMLPQKIEYDDWFAVLCAMVNTFGHDVASMLSRQKWDDRDIPYKISTIKRQEITFASMVHIGQRYGWTFSR